MRLKKYTQAFFSRLTRLKKILFPSTQFQKSFSQLGEDLIIASIFSQLNIARPSYIDIGAFDPYNLSNTALLYERGSTGVNIEPNPLQYKKFLGHRKRDINLNFGIGNQDNVLDYYVLSASTLNTFSKENALEFESKWGQKIISIVKVEVKTLPWIINKYCGGVFPHLLSIDVEGLELDIVKSISNMKSLPLVICSETLSYANDNSGIKDYVLINYIVDMGYFVYADTHLNTVFVNKKIWSEVN